MSSITTLAMRGMAGLATKVNLTLSGMLNVYSCAMQIRQPFLFLKPKGDIIRRLKQGISDSKKTCTSKTSLLQA